MASTMHEASEQDLEHLRTLSICHYVWAGVLCFFSLIPVIHLVGGILIVTGKLDMDSGGPPPWFGWLFIGIATFAIVMGLMMSCCVALAGRRLSEHRSHTFCLVVAGLSCTFMPFGTILGIFTLLVLMRPAVKSLFEQQAATFSCL